MNHPNRNWRQRLSAAAPFPETAMLAKDAIQGRTYRILACPPHEYLTIGQIYQCTHQGKFSTGLHRPDDGGGTYLTQSRTYVVLEPA